MQQFENFKDFYPYYLSQHQHKTCRLLHFVGLWFVILTLAYVIITQNWWALLLTPIFGYGFAWIGHYFFEKNKPATFDYPLYSFFGDWVMFKDILIGKIKLF